MARYLIFDSYGTLVEMDDFYGRLQAGFAKIGAALPLEVVVKAAHREMRHYMERARFARDHKSWHDLRHECAGVLAAAIREQNYPLNVPPDTVAQVLFDSVVFRALPHVQSTLEELKARGMRLGVLSNWDFRLPVALEETGLAHLFDFVLTSAGAGSEKPKREIFEKGLALARRFAPNLATRDCYYVGDHYEKDVLGARAAGLSPLWLVSETRDIASGDIHDAHDSVPRLRSLRDLLKLFRDETTK